MKRILLLFMMAFNMMAALSQQNCGTMLRLENLFTSSPELRARFMQQRGEFQKALQETDDRLNRESDLAVYTIPVVFHIVLNNPSVVTEAMIKAQLDTLNNSFAGTDWNLEKITPGFKPLFGKSSIRFCLAQRTEYQEATNGIVRINSAQSSFSTDDRVKFSSRGGSDGWNQEDYLNIWVCQLSGGILGYASFPDDGEPDAQGIVIDYRTLPGGSYPNYNTGKTLTHEAGHFFNLYHIWGDDSGLCSGSDYVDDTPNQANSSSGCSSGIRTDNCTNSGNGIMYQNYMDYSHDACLLLFTLGQTTRMEAALLLYRSSLLNSDGCQPPLRYNLDAALLEIVNASARICSMPFNAVISVQNRGVQMLNAVTINISIDDRLYNSYRWQGTLNVSGRTEITLPAINTDTGMHTLTVTLTLPNDGQDEDDSNNSSSFGFQFYNPVNAVSEGFENNIFPSRGWDIINPDLSISWQKNTSVAQSGQSSAFYNTYDYEKTGEQDLLRLPEVSLPDADSAFISFQVAAAAYTPVSISGVSRDTLEVLVSQDCGETYTSLYRKAGRSLITRTSATSQNFVPSSSEWRLEKIDLYNYIGKGKILIAFRAVNGNDNNIYLDNINVYTVTVNPNLKREGFLVSPNPVRQELLLQFYPAPERLRSIQLFNGMGQLITEIRTQGNAENQYRINMSAYSAGAYFIRAVFSDRVITRKLLKH